jgi:hypothetical protein
VTIPNSDSVFSWETGGQFWFNKKLKKSTYLIELDVRTPLALTMLQGSEYLRLYNVVYNFTNSNPA